MAFCPNCGTPNTENADKCPTCGFELAVPKQAKFKGTIMMSGIKAPLGEAKDEADESSDAETKADAEPEKPSLPPVPVALSSTPTPPSIEGGRNPNFAKTMLGHVSPLLARPPEEPTVPAVVPAAAAPEPPAATSATAEPAPVRSEPTGPQVTPKGTVVGMGAPPLPPSMTVTQDERASTERAGPASPTASSSSAASNPARPARVGTYESTLPPSAAPAAPAPGKILALGCGAALALFLVVGGILYFVIGPKIRAMMGSEDSAAEAAEWQASIVQSLAQVSELCKTDCTQAAVYFHPQREAELLSEARFLTPARLQKLSDSSQTEAAMLNGTDDEAAATRLGLDPQQCARVKMGAAKVISCSVPDPGGRPSVLRIVDLAGVGTL